MSEETDAIRQDIASVRESITDKIEQIESKVRGTVDTKVDQFHQLFDVQHQVRERPWATLGVAALVGFAAGSMGAPKPARAEYRRYTNSAYAYTNGSARYAPAGQPTAYKAQQSQDMIRDLTDQFGDELRLMTSAALAAGMHLLRDTLSQSVPDFDREYRKQEQSL